LSSYLAVDSLLLSYKSKSVSAVNVEEGNFRCDFELSNHFCALCGQNISFLDALAKFRKVTLNFVMSALSSAWNSSPPTGWVYWNFIFDFFFSKICREESVSLKSDKNNGYFTWRHMHIYDNISLSSS